MSTSSFEQECKEWLLPFGYNLHSSNTAKTVLTFTVMDPDKDRYLPAIRCHDDANGRYITLLGPILSGMVNIHVEKLVFKHSGLAYFLSAFAHYTKMCVSNPWSSRISYPPNPTEAPADPVDLSKFSLADLSVMINFFEGIVDNHKTYLNHTLQMSNLEIKPELLEIDRVKKLVLTNEKRVIQLRAAFEDKLREIFPE